ncbi:hypothetical protein Uis1B_2281, partial [Bifidobacterium margollesii]
ERDSGGTDLTHGTWQFNRKESAMSIDSVLALLVVLAAPILVRRMPRRRVFASFVLLVAAATLTALIG